MRALLGHRVQPWHAGVLVGVVIAMAIGGYLWLAGGESAGRTADAPPAEAAERGTACAHLSEAFAHSQAGEAEALRQSAAAAARAGEKALETSGQEFGRPEELALEIEYALTQKPAKRAADVAMLLSRAREMCQRLGRWPGSSR